MFHYLDGVHFSCVRILTHKVFSSYPKILIFLMFLLHNLSQTAKSSLIYFSILTLSCQSSVKDRIVKVTTYRCHVNGLLSLRFKCLKLLKSYKRLHDYYCVSMKAKVSKMLINLFL